MKVISSKNNETYKFLVKVSKKSNVRKKSKVYCRGFKRNQSMY